MGLYSSDEVVHLEPCDSTRDMPPVVPQRVALLRHRQQLIGTNEREGNRATPEVCLRYWGSKRHPPCYIESHSNRGLQATDIQPCYKVSRIQASLRRISHLIHFLSEAFNHAYNNIVFSHTCRRPKWLVITANSKVSGLRRCASREE